MEMNASNKIARKVEGCTGWNGWEGRNCGREIVSFFFTSFPAAHADPTHSNSTKISHDAAQKEQDCNKGSMMEQSKRGILPFWQ